jgi:sulfonate transport system substrate-binding protein
VNTRPSRRRLRYAILLALAAGTTLSACASGSTGASSTSSSSDLPTSTVSAAALSKVTINVVDMFGQQLLSAAGLADTPYKVNYVVANYTAATVSAAFSSGAADLLITNDIIFSSILSAGVPVTFIHAQQRPPSLCGILVPPASTITSVSGLKGETIGNVDGQSSEIVAIRAFKAAGLNYREDAHVVDFAAPADGSAALISHQVDALAACSQVAIALTSTHQARFVVDGGNGLWAGQNYWGVQPSDLQDAAKRTAILDYIKRVDEAMKWGNAHLAAESQAEATFQKAPYAVTLAYNQVGPSTPVDIGPSVAAGLQGTYDIEASLGRVKAGVDVSKSFTTAYNAYFANEG